MCCVRRIDEEGEERRRGEGGGEGREEDALLFTTANTHRQPHLSTHTLITCLRVNYQKGTKLEEAGRGDQSRRAGAKTGLQMATKTATNAATINIFFCIMF